MRRQTRNTLLAVIGASVMIAVTSGCSSPATSSGMKPKALKIEKRYPYSIQIKMGGGRSTDPLMDAPQVSNEAFAKAMTDVITESKLFAEVIPQGQHADYLLSVEIISVEQPIMGFRMTVRIEAAWELTKAGTDNPALRELIISSYTAEPGEAFAGVTRCRLATEGAARNNIEQGMTKIAQLTL